MTKAALGFVNDVMESAKIPYEFMEFKSDIRSIPAYWVGSYAEEPTPNEDGMEKTQFILTGTGKENWSVLEQQKEKIKEIFPEILGKTAILDNGSGIAVFYENAFSVPTGDEFLKRLQVNLVVKEWKVK